MESAIQFLTDLTGIHGLLPTILATIVVFLVVLTMVVFVHEWGHYIVARLSGVRVDVFSVGFGREVFGWTAKDGTRWRIGCVPIGGYVRMFGDDDPFSGRSETRDYSAEERRYTFCHRPVSKRIAIAAAGPVFNFLFAALVLAVLYSSVGERLHTPILAEVVADSPAERAGLRPGDLVVEMGGRRIESVAGAVRQIRIGRGATMAVTVERAGERVSASLTPDMVEKPNLIGDIAPRPWIGVKFRDDQRRVEVREPAAAVISAFGSAVDMVRFTARALGQIASGDRPVSDLGGPLQIAQATGEVAALGGYYLAQFMALLSINLGLLNLLPIPMLDGGHLLFYGIEAARGRPLSERMQNLFLRLGFGLVLGIMFYATWNDISRMLVRLFG